MPRRHYQTTPIFYVNDRPHLGTAYAVISADALARWHRLVGDEVLFLTGTDEHGLKLQRVAEDAGVTPKAWADRTSQVFRDAWESLEISNDDFIRTTDDRHKLAVQRFIQSIYDNGYIYLGTYEGWYCVQCEAYYTEEELAPNRTCPIHGRPVEWLSEENYFFALSRFTDALLEWYEANPKAVRPDTRRNEALSFIRQGLGDISISRTSIDWGIPVPWDERHVVYVWYDALINYCTAAGYGSDEERFAAWWPVVHHLVGKDILRFHAVWWPAMCMAAGITPPAEVLAHGFLLVSGEKMSKSRANQIDPVALAQDVGVDALRYHLLRDVVLGTDSDFSYEGLLGRYNSDLANNLGNLLSRVATVVASRCEGIGPPPRPDEPGHRLARFAEATAAAARDAWERSAPNEALEATWRLIRETNAELEAREPWKLPPGPEVEGVLGDALEVLRIVAILASPAIPGAARRLWERLGLPGVPDEPGAADPEGGRLGWGGYPGGLPVTKGEPLFPRRRDLETGASPAVASR
ncbi:MAG: methionyl-tRNA synthetase [Acidimicrobiaceae bacterium]|nr:methionyl-tRNA synthetase [Acidimicrobiaceae bacterium]